MDTGWNESHSRRVYQAEDSHYVCEERVHTCKSHGTSFYVHKIIKDYTAWLYVGVG